MNTLTDTFFLTAGSIIGRDHVRVHRNNQDGVALAAKSDLLIAAVTDGCSSGRYSEVGARLGAAWLVRRIDALVRDGVWDDLPKRTAGELVDWLGAVVASLGAPDARDEAELLHQNFLFTYLAAVVTPERTLVFGQGDGVVSVNGVVRVLDSGPENAPRYAAYAVVAPERLAPGSAPALEPIVLHDGPTAEVRTLAIGTDGVADLIARAADPLSNGQVPGGLEQFEEEPRYLANPTLVHKRLVVLGEGHGRLRDDTTLALVRRREVPTCRS